MDGLIDKSVGGWKEVHGMEIDEWIDIWMDG